MKQARETFDVAVKLAGQNAELVKRQTAGARTPDRRRGLRDPVRERVR